MYNKIHLKRLKRKRKLQNRVKCHGSSSICTHVKKITKLVQPKVLKKNWWLRFLDFIFRFYF